MHWEVWKLQEEISNSSSWSIHGTWPDLVRFQKFPILLVQSACTKFLIKSNQIHSHARQTIQYKFVRIFAGGWLDLLGRGWLWSLLTCWPVALQRAACLVSPPPPLLTPYSHCSPNIHPAPPHFPSSHSSQHRFKERCSHVAQLQFPIVSNKEDEEAPGRTGVKGGLGSTWEGWTARTVAHKW